MTAQCTHCGKPKEVDHETIDPRYPMVRCLNADREIVIRPGFRGDAGKIIAERRARRRRVAHERHSLKAPEERPKSCAECQKAVRS